jgi:hypothetical protein
MPPGLKPSVLKHSFHGPKGPFFHHFFALKREERNVGLLCVGSLCVGSLCQSAALCGGPADMPTGAKARVLKAFFHGPEKPFFHHSSRLSAKKEMSN